MDVVVAHCLPGRARLLLPGLRGRPGACRAASGALSVLPGVRDVRINQATGSLLLQYDPGSLSLDRLLDQMRHPPARREVAASLDRHFVRTRPMEPMPHPPRGAPATSGRGLTQAEVRLRQKRFGPNLIPAPAPPPFGRRLLSQFSDLSTIILLTGTGLAALTGRVVEMAAVGAVTAITAVIGAWRDGQRDTAVSALQQLVSSHTTAIRDSRAQVVPTEGLVPGDLILLRAGDRVPADLVIMTAADLEVEDRHLFDGDAGPHLIKTDRFLAAGGEVTRGRAEAVVVATGRNTTLGGIASTLGETEAVPSPVERRIKRLARDLLKMALAGFGVVTVAGLFYGLPLAQILEGAVSVATAAIPEGLPTFITLAMAAGARRLARRGSYVRDLAAAEGVGAVDVICTDKTGTLTHGEMTVRTVYAGGSWWSVTGTGTELEGQFLRHGKPVSPLEEPDLRAFVDVAGRCNNATLLEGPDGLPEVSGSQTEGALLIMALKAGLNPEAAREERLDEESFDPARRRMSLTLGHKGARLTCSKGAPEVILPACNRVLRGGQVEPLDAPGRAAVAAAVRTLATGGHRVIALSYAYGDQTAGGYIFAGLAGIIDPPRRELRPVIRRLGQSGIRTIMLTGDHPDTAAAVAGELGLLHGKLQVVTGSELNQLTDGQLDRIVGRAAVFARVTPDQKARIVRSLQRRGRTVAVVGDGMDDAPAVRAADIGVAPRERGTDVTREAARIILTEDRFETLARAIEQGRTTARNNDDIARYLLTTNTAEILVMLAAAVCGLPLPLLPLHLLWLNLIGDGPAALALGERHAEASDKMPERPRPVQSLEREILAHGLEMGAASFGLFISTIVSGGTVAAARTMALTALGASQILYLFRCRTALGTPCGLKLPAEPTIGLAAGVSALLLLATVYFPPLAGALGTVPLSMGQWLAVLGAGLAGNLSAVAGFRLAREPWAALA